MFRNLTTAYSVQQQVLSRFHKTSVVKLGKSKLFIEKMLTKKHQQKTASALHQLRENALHKIKVIDHFSKKQNIKRTKEKYFLFLITVENVLSDHNALSA